MGWSAFAGKMVRYGKEEDLTHIERDDTTMAPFREAAARVTAASGSVDARLETGAVHGSRSAEMLKRALGTCSHYGEWAPDTVRDLAAKADWSFEVEPTMAPYKMSVQAFIEICVAHGYGIGF